MISCAGISLLSSLKGLYPLCDHRYNALVYVPYQLERLLSFGVLLCLDSFLVISTLTSSILSLSVSHSLRCISLYL